MNNIRRIRAGWLIDGTGRSVQQDAVMLIENNYIQAVMPITGDMPQPDSDLSDYTILPGLIDSHLHLSMSGKNDPEIRTTQLTAPFEDVKDIISEHIQQLLAYGVIAARDGGDHYAHALRYKQKCLIPGEFCLKVAGKAWHKPGRYGSLIGRPPSQTLAEAILTHSDGADHVKIVQSGLNSLKNFGKQTPPQFSSDELSRAVETANHLKLPVMVHTNGEIPTRIAIEAGCHSVEHGFFMGEDNLRQMADKGIFWVPTAYTMKAYAEQLHGSKEADIARKNLDHQLEQIAKAKQFGVLIAVGTDAGCPGVHHGAAIIEELKLLMHAGFSLSEAIQCSTLNGAKLLGLKDSGRLAPGMKADFIAVKGTPACLPDYPSFRFSKETSQKKPDDTHSYHPAAFL